MTTVMRLVTAHPYLAGSVVLHGWLAALLLQLPGMGEAARARSVATEATRAAQQIAQTQARELQGRVQRMEEILRLLGEAAGTAPVPASGATGSSPAALLARAQALSAVIDAAQRRLRATELARLTGLPLAEAARELEAKAAAEQPPITAATPAETIARLERRAKAALAAQRSQLEAQRNGVRVTQAGVADGIPRSAAEQLAAMTRLGPPQGRVGVPGVAGGQSVHRPGAKGVAGGRFARPDDPALATPALVGPPVTVTGTSLDLTGNAAPGRSSGMSYLRPPRMERAALRTAAGRVFGAGGSFANRVYLDSWYVIGPFPGRGDRTLETVYPPEDNVDLDGAYPGLGGRTVAWHYASRGFYPFVPPDREERAVYFAYTELRIDEDRDLWLSIAADDDSMLWLDGRLVWTSERGDKPWYHPPFYLRDEQVASLALAEGHRRVHLSRGRHQLLLKLFNDRDRSFFSVVVAP
ncbi:MAG TPA: hypothetical protein VLA16_11440 [Ideonella sp.]|nr:hypothetical protein [Ideonella sp.]